jgi:hypothetical protein
MLLKLLIQITWPETILMFVKINPNGKQLVVYRVTTLLFPGKQPHTIFVKKNKEKPCHIKIFYENSSQK